MKKSFYSVVVLAIASVGLFISCNPSKMKKNDDKLNFETILQKQLVVQNKYDIAKYEWYEVFEKGVMTKAPQAKLALDSAQQMIFINKLKEANILLDRADKLLSFYDTTVLVKYETQHPLLKPDLSKLRQTVIGDYEAEPISGVLKTDVGGGFWGWGDDGNFYAIMPLVNFHNAGKVVLPIVFDFVTSIHGQNKVVYINKLPTITKTANSICYNAVDGDKYQKFTIVKENGKTHVMVEGSGDGLSFNIEWTANFAYWYNQNQGAAIGYPETGFSGTEEIGRGSGTFTLNGKTVKLENAAGELENLCDGALPGVNHKVNYRKQMTIYGNEFWTSIHSDQFDAQIILFGRFRDAAIFYDGEYIVPSEIKFYPIVGGKSFILYAKTAKGDLIARADVQCMEPMFEEYGCSLTGTIFGKPITNGYLWVEHTTIGGIDGVSLEDAEKKAPVN